MPLIWATPEKRFTGTWDDRLDSLFSVGVDYAGKSILDLGCNMGVVAYEIAKQGPSFIHGVEKHPPHVYVAQTIFSGVGTPSRFDCTRIGSSQFYRLLRPSYDIVLMLAVYHHFRRKLGPENVKALLRSLTERTTTIIVRDPGRTIVEITSGLLEFGFLPIAKAPPTPSIGGLTVFRRST